MSSVDLIIEMEIAIICFSFDMIYGVYELDSYTCMDQNLLCISIKPASSQWRTSSVNIYLAMRA